MNFFEHQDEARRTTRRLVLLFCLAVFCLLLLTNIAVIGAVWFIDVSIFEKHQAYLNSIGGAYQEPNWLQTFLAYFDLRRVLFVSLVIVFVIALVIFKKRHELSGGGKIIATRLGGRRVLPDTQNANERLLMNVVEEMAIASGMAVPPVYVLPEQGINAFAAGFNPNDAVIGVSQGAIETLDREQLQGVIAHEFSHIFNGDMRLNINLIAVLAGILFIGHAGWFVVRMFGSGRSRSSRDNGSAFVIMGLLLVAIGAIGTFFGKLIKSAVSRQREFLADASAVQFTRHPEGIAGALKLIGGARHGSLLGAAHAEEMSHLFFSDALQHRFNNKLSSWFATHPPLDERIRRIEPRWDGKYLRPSVQAADTGKVLGQTSSPDKAAASLAAAVPVMTALQASVEQVGQPDAASQHQAQRQLQSINSELFDALHRLSGAKAFCYLLLLDSNREVRIRQTNYLNAHEDDACKKDMMALYNHVQQLERKEWLNLVEVSVPALKTMSSQEYQGFLKHLVFLVRSDNHIELFEWLLHSLLVHYLKPHFYPVQPPEAKYRQLSMLRNECRLLLSHLSYFGKQGSAAQYQQVFAQGFNSLDLGETQIIDQSQLQLGDLDSVMYQFARLYPLLKPRLLKACALCIQADAYVSIEQFELLRVMSALIDCPMPLMELEADEQKN